MNAFGYWGTRMTHDVAGKPADLPKRATGTAEWLFLHYAPRVYNLARRLLGDDAEAEEVTQDVLFQAVAWLDAHGGEVEVAEWLLRRVAEAVRLRRLRANGNRRRSFSQLLIVHSDSPSATHCGVGPAARDRGGFAAETCGLIEEAISRLPEVYRDVYVLADVEGCANARVGEALGLSAAAVTSRLHRARLLMRKTLAPHFEGPTH